jgi:hypothetical protein
MRNRSPQSPTFITVRKACEIIGGDRPVHVSTFYRGVRLGIYPAPRRVSPGVSRVDAAKLASALSDPKDKDVA